MPYNTKNAVRLVKTIVREEGAMALFKGNLATVFRVLPYSGVQLMSYDQFKTALLRYKDNEGGRLSPVEKIFAGACAGASSVMVTYPLDLVRARLAVQRETNHYRGVGHAFRNIVRREVCTAVVLQCSKLACSYLCGVVPPRRWTSAHTSALCGCCVARAFGHCIEGCRPRCWAFSPTLGLRLQPLRL